MNNTRAHKLAVAAIRKRLGREQDFTLYENSRVTVVNGVPHASPGLCKGASDFIGILAPHGRIVALELKTGAGKTTELQDMFLELVRKRGGFACVIRGETPEDAAENAFAALDRARAGLSE